VMFEPIGNLVVALMKDPSFTGRDVIWSFALDRLAQRPLFGYGFEAFWGMPDLLALWSPQEQWGLRASDAHNGCLNLAVTTGLVGLGLALTWFVLQPFADFRRAREVANDPALTALFLQIWLFGLCLGGFESVFFAGGSALWSLMIVAIIGLRFQTIARSSE
jgi:O-antigen ligase